MPRRPVILSILIPAMLIAGAGAGRATGEMETPTASVTFFRALYDGLTEECRAELQEFVGLAKFAETIYILHPRRLGRVSSCRGPGDEGDLHRFGEEHVDGRVHCVDGNRET